MRVGLELYFMVKTKSGNTKTPVKNESSRQPGESSVEKIVELNAYYLLWLVMSLLCVGFAVLEWVHYYAKTPPIPIPLTVLAAIVLSFGLWNMSRIKKEVKNRELGLEGEREVADELENLMRRGCYVYHDLQCEGDNSNKFNIDHVIVSTYGIYVIETKAYSKPKSGPAEVIFDGNIVTLTGKSPDSKPIQQAINNARWLRDQIYEKTDRKSFDVTAIVVFPGWLVPADQIKRGNGVWVMNPIYLESKITKAQITVKPADVELVKAALRPLTRVRRGSNY
jgi:hypothetical protein